MSFHKFTNAEENENFRFENEGIGEDTSHTSSRGKVAHKSQNDSGERRGNEQSEQAQMLLLFHVSSS